jgi:hypothetical protein
MLRALRNRKWIGLEGISTATYTGPVVSVTTDPGHDASDMDHLRCKSLGDHLRLLWLLRRIDLGGEAIVAVL